VQPFQAAGPHPARRARPAAGEEFQRRADAQADPRGPPGRGDRLGQQLLARRADGKEGEARRIGQREAHCRRPGVGIGLEPQRRIEMRRRREAAARHQRGQQRGAQADDGDPLPRADMTADDLGREIAARRDGGTGQAQQPRRAGDHAGIQQNQHGAAIDLTQCRTAVQADQMVGIGSDDIGEAVFRRPRCEQTGGVAHAQIVETEAQQRRHRDAAEERNTLVNMHPPRA